jgi:translation initiation factor 6
VANDKGILVGSSTTGPEILRIQKALGEWDGGD